MKKTRILIVDDELSIIKYLRSNLENHDYQVLTAMDGSDAIQVVEMEMPDLIILDIMMPKMDGYEVCRRIREWSQMPIIMLSALGDEMDKVKCLNLGADDYITKPFGSKELIARVQAVLRRNEKSPHLPGQASFTSGNLVINFVKHQVNIGDKEVKLTPTEYNLLQEMALNAGKVLPYTHLLNKVWGSDYRDEKEYLHVFIGRLRAKLESNIDAPEYIVTVPRVGYILQTSE